jgi:hypothetical protein
MWCDIEIIVCLLWWMNRLPVLVNAGGIILVMFLINVVSQTTYSLLSNNSSLATVVIIAVLCKADFN